MKSHCVAVDRVCEQSLKLVAKKEKKEKKKKERGKQSWWFDYFCRDVYKMATTKAK